MSQDATGFASKACPETPACRVDHHGSPWITCPCTALYCERWTFGDDARMDDAGVLKGVRNPGNIKMWINPLGPGQYPAVDGMEQAAKVAAA